MQDRCAPEQESGQPGSSPFSRRMFLGAGAAVAAGAALGPAGQAFAAPAGHGKHVPLAPFGPVPVTDPSVNGSYARAVRLTSGSARLSVASLTWSGICLP